MFAIGTVKQFEELVSMGGKFYTAGGASYCDTPLNSWRLQFEEGKEVGHICIE